MVIFPMLIVVSITLYIYFKVSILKLGDGLKIHYTNAKARIALGSFVFFFGINQYATFQSKLSLFIGIVFLIVGGLQLFYGRKLFLFYGKQLKDRQNVNA